MAEPRDEVAAGGHGRLRASHADREQVIDDLKTAFAQGQLDRDEFGLRVGRALESRTCAELGALTADIAARLTRAQPHRLPAREWPGQKAVKPLACVTAVVVSMIATLSVAAKVTHWDSGGRFYVQFVILLAALFTLLLMPLAAGLRQASRRHRDAIEQYERALADQEQMHGCYHPGTIAARAALATALRAAGKPKDAIVQYERVLADRDRTSGPDHPDTIVARANLAFAYRSAGRLREAVPLYERTLADRERVQGRDHRDTLTARANLAACYQLARRLPEAIPAYKRALADSERMLGPGDIETLTTRCNLATAYYTAGRLTDVVVILRRALTDCERYLGPNHPMTQTVRENLAAASQI